MFLYAFDLQASDCGRVKEEAQRVADARQERAHGFQDKYVAALEHQESMNEALIRTEEEQVSAMRALVESEMETSEVKDEFSALGACGVWG